MSDKDDELVRLLYANAPAGRLAAHREFWGTDAPDIVTKHIDRIAAFIAMPGPLNSKALSMLKDLDRWRNEYPTAKARQKGGKHAREIIDEEVRTRVSEARMLWAKFAHIPERNRTSRIASKMGMSSKQIRRYLNKEDTR